MNQRLQNFAMLGPIRFSSDLTYPSLVARHFNPHVHTLVEGESGLHFQPHERTNDANGVRPTAYLCVAAELATEIMMDASMPPGLRWSRTGMSIRYVAESRHELQVKAIGSAIDWASLEPQVVKVEGCNFRGDLVFQAEVSVVVKPV